MAAGVWRKSVKQRERHRVFGDELGVCLFHLSFTELVFLDLARRGVDQLLALIGTNQ